MASYELEGYIQFDKQSPQPVGIKATFTGTKDDDIIAKAKKIAATELSKHQDKPMFLFGCQLFRKGKKDTLIWDAGKLICNKEEVANLIKGLSQAGLGTKMPRLHSQGRRHGASPVKK